MKAIKTWEHFFKPEVRSSGRLLVSKGQVSLKQPSDTELVAFLRVSAGFRVRLKLDRVESTEVKADCSCPLFKKGQFCKHLWATLLEACQKSPDFFEAKTELTIDSSPVSSKSNFDHVPHAAEDSRLFGAQKRVIEKTEMHQKKLEAQSLYRKLQYQKQKLRLKKMKLAKKNQVPESKFPASVEEALTYFLDNGFDLRAGLTKESVNLAKKKLARVFHPDLGGSHREILELNGYAEILSKFLL